MSNICDTQYKVRGSRKALSDLWNTLQMMEVNSKDVYLYKLAEHYSIDYEHSCISVRGHIYWAEFEDNKDGGLLSFDTESAWSACDLFFDELNKVLGNELSISYREIECGCEIFYVHDVGGFFPEECCVSRDSITKCKIFVLNSHHIFDARDLMADWGWGFTNPQPLPNPILSRAKGNFQLAIQKKETEVSLRLTNFVLHMYKQLTSEQRSQIFVLLQKKIKRKEIAILVGCSQSTLSREIRRNSTDKGNYLWDKAHAKAMDRRKRTTANHAKDPAIVWEALDLLKEDYWSPEQISADMKSRGKNISHELIYRHIRADQSGELASYCRHKMKYNRHVRPNRTTKVKNIPDSVSIHQRPAEADGTRFGDWEMDTIVGKDGKGAILTLTERSTNMILMERLPEGKHPEPLAKVVVRLLFPYRKTIRSITTDNGSEFCAHKLISKGLAPKGAKDPNLVFFADSYCSWQKGSIENANKLIRQYIPKGTDFSTLTDAFIRKIQHKINRRPRKKLNFETPKDVFFRQINNFAVAG